MEDQAMRIVLLTCVLVGVVSIIGCKAQPAESLAMVPPVADFGDAPVYGSADMDSSIAFEPQLNPIAPKPEPVFDDAIQPQVQRQAVESRVHVVARRETLWSIAVRYYGDGKRWSEIAAANQNIEPTKLAIGKRLILP
jgi:hypothetical protein